MQGSCRVRAPAIGPNPDCRHPALAASDDVCGKRHGSTPDLPIAHSRSPHDRDHGRSPSAPTAAAAAGPAASASRCPSSSSATPRRSTSTGGSPPSTSPARSRTPACSPPSACSSPGDLAAIERGMDAIRGRDRAPATFAWSRDLEDVHLNIEKRLTALVGDAGKRLHTARSRNDQVATDMRLWLRGEIDALSRQLAALRRALIDLAERHADTIMPGFTHLQVAQPVTFGHHLLAYDAMLARDMRAPRRLPPARQPAAARQRRARRHELSDRPRARRAGAGLRRPVRATRSTPCPIATSRSNSPRRRRWS